MESRAFIAHAQTLIEKINELASFGARDDVVQREINNLLSGLQNPTLPSASRLVATALATGYTVKAEVQHRLQQAENYWG